MVKWSLMHLSNFFGGVFWFTYNSMFIDLFLYFSENILLIFFSMVHFSLWHLFYLLRMPWISFFCIICQRLHFFLLVSHLTFSSIYLYIFISSCHFTFFFIYHISCFYLIFFVSLSFPFNSPPSSHFLLPSLFSFLLLLLLTIKNK